MKVEFKNCRESRHEKVWTQNRKLTTAYDRGTKTPRYRYKVISKEFVRSMQGSVNDERLRHDVGETK